MSSYIILMGAIRADDHYNIIYVIYLRVATQCAVKSLIPMMLSVRFHVTRSRIYIYIYAYDWRPILRCRYIIYASIFVSVTWCANAKGWKIITREKKNEKERPNRVIDHTHTLICVRQNYRSYADRIAGL